MTRLPKQLQQFRIYIAHLMSFIFVWGTSTLIAHAQKIPGDGGQLYNPLGDNVTLTGIISRIIGFLLGFVGILSLLAVIVGGLYIINSYGNDKQVAKGKQIIFWALAGIVVTALAYVILGTVVNAFLGVSGLD